MGLATSVFVRRRRASVAGTIVAGAIVSAAGCALLPDPYPALGAEQDTKNRRINAQYSAAMPDKLRTDYELRGWDVNAAERRDDWKAFLELFRWHPSKQEWVDPVTDCDGPDEVRSCSRSEGCRCVLRRRPPPSPAVDNGVR